MLINVLTIIFSILVVGGNITYFIYRKIKKLPTGECKECRKGSQKLIQEYRKMYKDK